MSWEGYFIFKRIGNINDENWSLLIDELDEIVGVGDLPNQVIRKRGNLDMFQNVKWYSNEYIYAANFNEEAVSFAKFKNRLVNLFDVPDENVTFSISTRTLRNRLSVTGTYQLNAVDRVSVELLGCASDVELCTKDESNQELLQFIFDYALDYGEIVA